MDLPIYNTNHNDPPGPLVTMDPTSYIPTAADSMVPLPPGLQISILESSIDTTHPITLSYRLAEADLPQPDTGIVHYHAFTHISEFFSHGFNPIEDNTPECETWITAATQGPLMYFQCSSDPCALSSHLMYATMPSMFPAGS